MIVIGHYEAQSPCLQEKGIATTNSHYPPKVLLSLWYRYRILIVSLWYRYGIRNTITIP